MSFLRSFAFAIALCPQIAEADDYFVDLDAGSDAASGSEVAPWRTLTHALATVAPSSGHRVLVRGTANLSSPGEVFPIRLPAGISLEAWDAQQGAVLDAEYLPCLEIVGPAPREQSLRGYERNLRFLGVPAISVEVQGVEESVDLVVENCGVGGELRMILAEVAGQTRRGSCALTLRSCNLSDVTVDCRSSSISTTENVLSVSVEDSVGGSLLLRGLSAPTRPLELQSSYFWNVGLESCAAASVSIVDNDFGWMRSELSASSILYERNRLFGSCVIAALGRLEVLSNYTELGLFDIRGSGTTRIERNSVPNGWIEFDSIGALEAPCSILRNGTTFLKVAAIGSQPLTIAENYVSAKMTLSALPHAAVDVVGNVVGQWVDPGTGIDLRPKLVPWIPGAPLVTIADNRLEGIGQGVGLLIEGTLGKLVIERNEIQGFPVGLQTKGNTVVHGTPNGWNCRIERNSIGSSSGIGVDLDLSSSQEDLRFLNNELLGFAEALRLNRDTYRGTIRCWNNIFRSYGSRSVSGTFSPIDLVWNNLCSDGSLLALHPTNITGDPQFASSGRLLRASSPAVGSGIDPLTAEPGFNMGRDPLQPPATLHLRAQSETNAVLQLDAPNALLAVMIFGIAVSDPANLELCDGRAGVDLASGYYLAALPVANGEANLPVALPPGSWTAVVQALSFTEAPSLHPPCRASNTVVLRR